MPKVKMNQPVNWGVPIGVATPRQLLDRGLAEVDVISNFKGSAGGRPRKATFVQLKGTALCVEVSGYVR